ncbi:sensor domain-containing protein [Streptomyces tauricus]|uniref:sensor domain-containing protein n=1 Tax=Streptomyces tauricus TaxID=68274 RepID=UPI0033A5BCE9
MRHLIGAWARTAARRPLAAFTPRPLAALLYAAIAFPLALAGCLLTLAGLLVGGVLSVTTLGLWVLALTVRGALALGALQRTLARRLLHLDIEEPPSPAAAAPSAAAAPCSSAGPAGGPSAARSASPSRPYSRT